MTSIIDSITFDCQDARRVADFWAAVLDYEITKVNGGWITLSPRAGKPGPRLGFEDGQPAKSGKDRLHIDVKPAGSVDDEVKRLLALGATYEQRVVNEDGSWHVVLHDPEDNELCVLAP